MKIDYLMKEIEKLGVNFYTGVPDSQLKAFCDMLMEKFGIGKQHVIAANEGAAVGLAAGHYLATGNPAVVYMQNSGIGNAVNPICSLVNDKVYAIPVLFIIGWRGEPGVHDEPQHIGIRRKRAYHMGILRRLPRSGRYRGRFKFQALLASLQCRHSDKRVA